MHCWISAVDCGNDGNVWKLVRFLSLLGCAVSFVWMTGIVAIDNAHASWSAGARYF